MRKHLWTLPTALLVTVLAWPLAAQQAAQPQGQAPAAPARGGGAAGAGRAGAAQTPARGNPADTEIYTPVPKIITPGATAGAAPSDAIVLFDGTNLDEWVQNSDKSPAKWTVADGIVTVDKRAGSIETKRT